MEWESKLGLKPNPILKPKPNSNPIFEPKLKPFYLYFKIET